MLAAQFSPFTLTIALSHRGFFAQLDIGAVTRPNRRLVPVCPIPLDSRLRGNDVSCAKHPSRERGYCPSGHTPLAALTVREGGGTLRFRPVVVLRLCAFPIDSGAGV